jgi:hypothetical protein
MKKEKTSLRSKLIKGGFILGMTLGGISCSNNLTETTDIFRGYHNDIEEGRQVLIFDDETKEQRDSPRDINLSVYGSGADTLEINKAYVIGYLPSKIKGFPGRIKYINEANSLINK